MATKITPAQRKLLTVMADDGDLYLYADNLSWDLYYRGEFATVRHSTVCALNDAGYIAFDKSPLTSEQVIEFSITDNGRKALRPAGETGGEA
jgi:hypothetical protein